MGYLLLKEFYPFLDVRKANAVFQVGTDKHTVNGGWAVDKVLDTLGVRLADDSALGRWGTVRCELA
jgi:hypothetical protein